MAKLNVPIIAVITGEGCSGGALGLGVADKVLILEHSYYTVISPEGCASILWRDSSMTNTAAEALKITGPDLMQFNIVDEIVKEPVCSAHCNYQEMGEELKKSILNSLEKLSKFSAKELRENRYKKYRDMGIVEG